MVDDRYFVLFQAEDGIRDLVRSRGLGDVYKRQLLGGLAFFVAPVIGALAVNRYRSRRRHMRVAPYLSLIHI